MSEQQWSLEEANAILPQIIVATHLAARELSALERAWHGLPFRPYDPVRRATREGLIRADWAREILSLGAQPKGYFCVDFPSLEPEIVLCWIWGELQITHQHSQWESCLERRAIVDPQRFEHPHDENFPNDSQLHESDWFDSERD